MLLTKQNAPLQTTMENLSLEIFSLDGKSSQYAILPPNTSITIVETSDVFDNGDIWSYNFTLNMFVNSHIFSTSGDLHGSRIHEQIDKRKARLWVMGIPMSSGYLKLDDEITVDEEGNIDISFESGHKSFEKMIDGGKANQVPLLNDVLIGMALWRERSVKVKLQGEVIFLPRGNVHHRDDYDRTWGAWFYWPQNWPFNIEQEFSNSNTTLATKFPRMVFPKGDFAEQNSVEQGGVISVNTINTDIPYDEMHPFCNISLCYQKHGYPTKDGKVDYSSEEQILRGYDIAPANRVNSAPNFYVLYWLKCLMKHLNIHIDENQMEDIEDLRRLFMVNTKCAYEVPQDFDKTGEFIDEHFGYFTNCTDEYGRVKDYVAEDVTQTVDISKSCTKIPLECVECEVRPKDDPTYSPVEKGSDFEIVEAYFRPFRQTKLTDEEKKDYLTKNRFYHYAYATSECFPDVEITEIISALENAFGVRFIFDENYQRVRIVLLRNMFRDQQVQNINCTISSVEKSENNIRGFRMTYGRGDDDTEYYYKGFADKLGKEESLWKDKTDTHDYSHWDLDANYKSLINKISAFDKTCYVTQNNGNAYGIKVDKDARKYNELNPSLFGFAGFMDAEDGDCSGEEGTIHEINVGFTPAIMNDVNFDNEKGTNNTKQLFALFVNEDMRSRRPDLNDLPAPLSYNDSDAVYDVSKIEEKEKQLGLFSINSDLVIPPIDFPPEGDYRPGGHILDNGRIEGVSCVYKVRFKSVETYINEGIRLYLQDNYEPNDDGVSPLETHDWGLTLGIMRGSGNDAHINYDNDPDDAEGNSTWEISPGSSVTAHPDTCDDYGRVWDYDGDTGYNRICANAEDAIIALDALFPDPNFDLTNRSAETYMTGFFLPEVTDDEGKLHTLLMAGATKDGSIIMPDHLRQQYTNDLQGKSIDQIKVYDAERYGLFIEADSSRERAYTLLRLQKLAYADGDPVTVSGGTDIREGRFSLKLRAEKPNPFYNPGSADPEKQKKYLDITNPNLRGRGLCDQFYKEFSYWMRNARIAHFTLQIELAQLLAIDKTKRITIGDITGFVKKMEYSISSENGLGPVKMEIMYI